MFIITSTGASRNESTATNSTTFRSQIQAAEIRQIKLSSGNDRIYSPDWAQLMSGVTHIASATLPEEL